jgi:MYXO-CTERM domain-containing protein
MSKILAGLALATLAGAASAQTITFSVVFNPVGPVGNNTLVNGTVHVVWNGGTTGATGLAGGQFRIRFTDPNFTAAGIVNPLGSAAALEATGDRVGALASELPPGGGTISDRWTLGRRPKRSYFADATDSSTLTGGGGFRFPSLGTGPTDLAYTAETQAGVVYLTGRNGGGTENRIEFAQVARSLNGDPLFYESQTSFDLFKFQIRTPASGAGVIVALPEIAIATLYTSDSGAQTNATLIGAPGSVAYSPSPSTLALLGLGGLVAGRRRR